MMRVPIEVFHLSRICSPEASNKRLDCVQIEQCAGYAVAAACDGRVLALAKWPENGPTGQKMLLRAGLCREKLNAPPRGHAHHFSVDIAERDSVEGKFPNWREVVMATSSSEPWPFCFDPKLIATIAQVAAEMNGDLSSPSKMFAKYRRGMGFFSWKVREIEACALLMPLTQGPDDFVAEPLDWVEAAVPAENCFSDLPIAV